MASQPGLRRNRPARTLSERKKCRGTLSRVAFTGWNKLRTLRFLSHPLTNTLLRSCVEDLDRRFRRNGIVKLIRSNFCSNLWLSSIPRSQNHLEIDTRAFADFRNCRKAHSSATDCSFRRQVANWAASGYEINAGRQNQRELNVAVRASAFVDE